MTVSVLSRLLSPLARDGDPDLDRVKTVVHALGDCRFALRYVWDIHGPELPWLMLNPSLAGTTQRFDPTARRVIRFSYRWGFGSALLLNIVPKITAKPTELREWLRWDERADWGARDDLFKNWKRLQQELAHDAAMVAWGSSLDRSYDFDLMLEGAFDTINDPEGPRTALLRTFCLGHTSSGHPLHPMARGKYRVPDGTRPILYPKHHGCIVGLGEAA